MRREKAAPNGAASLDKDRDSRHSVCRAANDEIATGVCRLAAKPSGAWPFVFLKGEIMYASKIPFGGQRASLGRVILFRSLQNGIEPCEIVKIW